MNKNSYIIEISGLNKKYLLNDDEDLNIINNLDFKLKQKSKIAILGPSGSGKTTLLNILGLLDKDFEGKYLFNTTDIHVSFHRPTFEGKALIRTNILKLGRTITSIQGQLFSHENKLAATVLHTGMIVKKQEE